MYSHSTQIRVRYGETDQMGYVYYGNYALYYEVGRVEALRELGIFYKELEELYKIIMPVMSCESKYIRPAHYDELLTLITKIEQRPINDISFSVEIYNEDNDLINLGKVKLCFVDWATKKRIPIPDFIINKLLPYFEV
jgi:acyl-CoA thioester hydrolase